jgi:hypothetical protein
VGSPFYVAHTHTQTHTSLIRPQRRPTGCKLDHTHARTTQQEGERLDDIVGSPFYVAPEVLQRNYGKEVSESPAGRIPLGAGFPNSQETAPHLAEEGGVERCVGKLAVESSTTACLAWARAMYCAWYERSKLLEPGGKTVVKSFPGVTGGGGVLDWNCRGYGGSVLRE